MKRKEINYLRLDLEEILVEEQTYYRLKKGLVDFMNILEKDGLEIVGIQLDRKEDGSFGYNIGFLLGKLKNNSNEK